MKKIFLLLIIILLFAVCTLFFFPFSRPVPFPDVINKAVLSTSPVIFFVYPDKQKNEWKNVLADEKIIKLQEQFISQNVKNKYFASTSWAPLLTELKTCALLVLNYQGEKIDFYARLTPVDELESIMETAVMENTELIAREKEIRKKFDDIEAVFDNGKYLAAMRQLRSFLAVYSDSDSTLDAKDLLYECSKKSEVITYIKKNKEKINIKKLLYQVNESYQYKKFFHAEKICGIIISNYPNTDEAKEAQEIKNKIAEYAQEKFKAANKLYQDRKYDQALEAYSSLHEQFKGSHWDLFISGKIQQIQSNKDYREFRDDQEREYEALHIFRRAEKAFEMNSWDLAERLYTSIVRFYPDTEYLEQSKKQLKRMNELRYKVPQKKDNDS